MGFEFFPFRIGWIALFLATTWFSAVVSGDVLWDLRGVPAYGRLLNVGDGEIEWQSWTDEGWGPVTRRSRDELSGWVVTWDERRLESLQPGQWNGYREYAEELTEQRRDPVARALALRLWTIVAFHDDSPGRETRRAALRLLPQLARSEPERQMLVDLARIEGVSPMGEPDAPVAPLTPQMSDPNLRRRALELARLLRREEFEAARQRLAEPDLAAWLEQDPDAPGPESLISLTRLSRLPEAELLRLLRWEVRLEGSEDSPGGTVESSERVDWSLESARLVHIWPRLPGLDQLEGIDPQETVYRGGGWRPAEAAANQ